MLISWKNMSFIQTKLKVEKAFLIRSPHVRLVASSKRKRAGGNSSYPWLFQKPYRVWLISSGTHYSHRSKTRDWTLVKMDPALLMIEILFRSLLLLPSSSTAMWTLERSKSCSTVCKRSSRWIFLLKVFMVWQHTVFCVPASYCSFAVTLSLDSCEEVVLCWCLHLDSAVWTSNGYSSVLFFYHFLWSKLLVNTRDAIIVFELLVTLHWDCSSGTWSRLLTCHASPFSHNRINSAPKAVSLLFAAAFSMLYP